MTFKEQMTADLEKVFMNTAEHADIATINGAQVTVIWDSDTLNYRIRNDYNGLLIGDALFFISEAEWAKIPRVSNPPRAGEAISIDGRAVTISLISSNAGLYDITINFAGGKR